MEVIIPRLFVCVFHTFVMLWICADFKLHSMQNAVEQPPKFVGRWAGTFTINIFVVVWVLIVGFGFGGWASMTNFIHQIDTFGLFTKCYQCPPPPRSPPPLIPQVGAPSPAPANITRHHHLWAHRYRYSCWKWNRVKRPIRPSISHDIMSWNDSEIKMHGFYV